MILGPLCVIEVSGREIILQSKVGVRGAFGRPSSKDDNNNSNQNLCFIISFTDICGVNFNPEEVHL